MLFRIPDNLICPISKNGFAGVSITVTSFGGVCDRKAKLNSGDFLFCKGWELEKWD
jgi:hypothetical protein